MTRRRWLEVARILGTGVVILLYQLRMVPLPALLATVPVGLYPLVKTGLLDRLLWSVSLVAGMTTAITGRELVS